MKPWGYPELGYSAAPRRSKNDKTRTQFHRVTKSIQVLAGEVIEGFTVIGKKPERINSVLSWLCQCPQAHSVTVSHAALSAGAPTCGSCAVAVRQKALGISETTEPAA